MQFWKTKRNESARVLRLQHWQEGQRVLIMGEVSAEDVRWLSRRVEVVAVSDSNPECIKALGKRLDSPDSQQHIWLVSSDLTTTPWLQASFDHVWVCASRSRVDDDLLWRECARVLRAGGVLSVCVDQSAVASPDPVLGLVFGGFSQVSVVAKPSWNNPKTLLYQAIHAPHV